MNVRDECKYEWREGMDVTVSVREREEKEREKEHNAREDLQERYDSGGLDGNGGEKRLE